MNLGRISFGSDGEVAMNHGSISERPLQPYKVGDLGVENSSLELMSLLMSRHIPYNQPKAIVPLADHSRENGSLLSGGRL